MLSSHGITSLNTLFIFTIRITKFKSDFHDILITSCGQYLCDMTLIFLISHFWLHHTWLLWFEIVWADLNNTNRELRLNFFLCVWGGGGGRLVNTLSNTNCWYIVKAFILQIETLLFVQCGWPGSVNFVIDVISDPIVIERQSVSERSTTPCNQITSQLK